MLVPVSYAAADDRRHGVSIRQSHINDRYSGLTYNATQNQHAERQIAMTNT